MAKKHELEFCVENGRLNALEDAAGGLKPELGDEDFRLLLANCHAAQRAINAHADFEHAKFKVKVSADELHVVKDDK